MPEITDDQIAALEDALIAQAPDGLSETDLNKWLTPRMEQAIAQAEYGPSANSGVRGAVTAAAQALDPRRLMAGLGQAIASPLDTAQGLYRAHEAQAGKAADAFREGRYSEALGHGAATALPLIGPAAANAGERIGRGDIGGGLGEGAGLIASLGAPKVVGKAARATARAAQPLLRRGAGRAMAGALKIDRGYLEKMAGAKRKGIAKMEQEIIETAVRSGVNPLRDRGANRVQSMIEGTDAARTAKIQAAPAVPVRGSGRHALRAAGDMARRVRKGDAPQGDIAQVRQFVKDLTTSPDTSEAFMQRVSFPLQPVRSASGSVTDMAARAKPGAVQSRLKDLTPQELAETITAGNDRLRGLFSGQGKNAELRSRLAVQRARTKDLDRAAGTAPESQQLRQLIDLRNVTNIARRRADANNPISLTDVISLSAGRPAVLAGSIAMKPKMLADISVLLNTASRGAGRSTGATAQRGALLAALLGAEDDEP